MSWLGRILSNITSKPANFREPDYYTITAKGRDRLKRTSAPVLTYEAAKMLAVLGERPHTIGELADVCIYSNEVKGYADELVNHGLATLVAGNVRKVGESYKWDSIRQRYKRQK